ncbi:MAG: cobalamin B12-binding domain-containing protein [Deltaproteobacteria bacterium]|nr:cobalamin B12-binding domain-containing protein [Deltaproteobacteria bacterium]
MATTYDVLLLHHPTTNIHRPIRAAAVGLLGMADYLQRHGFAVQVVNLAIEQSHAPDFDVVDYAASTGARIIGISVHWFFQLNDSLDLARELKRRLPDALIVLGGFAASCFARDLIRDHPDVDVVIRGDGEVPLLALCAAFLGRRHGGWGHVPNLVYRDRHGAIAATPFTHVMGEALFGELRFMNLPLLKNHDSPKALYYPTKAFKDRFDFDERGVLCLAPTRGCVYDCALCGGNSVAQRTLFARHGVTFQPLDSVIADIRLALDHGFSNFYLCSDPDPNGPYYFDLFRRLRAEALDVGLLFETWSLPSAAFVDAFADTFARGMLILSPDSADEAIRKTVKGPLSYSNERLAACLAHLARRGLACQLFFGFFLPGDTTESVMSTRRFVHDCESDTCETVYLAFSTDPCTPVSLDPERFGMIVEVRDLRDYLEYLPRKRLSPNLLAHRPKAIGEHEANRLVGIINYDMVVHKLLPRTLVFLRAVLAGAERYHGTVESLLHRLAGDARAGGGETRPAHILRQVRDHLAAVGPGHDATWSALLEILDYETIPYALMEEHFGGLGMHYTSSCHEVALDGPALSQYRARTDTVSCRHRFVIDVKAATAALDRRQSPVVTPRPTTVGFVLDRTGTYATYYADGE